MKTLIEETREAIAQRKMNYPHWKGLPQYVREAARDTSELCPELVGLEGYRVEVTQYGARRRFNVGMSTGWRPIHIALHNVRSTGGEGITRGTLSDVRIIRKVR